jgi:uncharacterized protein
VRPLRPLGAAAAIGATCVAYGVPIDRHWYVLRREQLNGALRRAGTLRILHISDVHLQPGQVRRIGFLTSLAAEPYDLVVATGDLLGASGAEDAAVDALASLTTDGRPGLAVLGSNDLYGPVFKSPLSYFTAPRDRRHGSRLDTDRLVAGLAEAGWTTLRNNTTVVPTRAGTVAAGGIDDPHLHTTRLPTSAEVTPPVDDAVASIGLVHAPYRDALDVLVDAGHDLLLAGHTHGGQVRLPGIGALVANCDLPLGQTRGPSRYRDRWLHVSAGLGHSRYAPFRFACRPEASLLTLTG